MIIALVSGPPAALKSCSTRGLRAAITRLAIALVAAAAFVAPAAGAAQIEAQVKNWPVEAPPRSLPAHPASFPPYEVRTLANGLQVVVVLHHEQPVVSARLLVRAGAAQDPTGKSGVASMVAALLDQGTTKRGAQQIADAIDFVGGELAVGAGADLTHGHVVVMKDSFGFGLELLSDVMRDPAFAPEEIERQRTQMRSALRVGYDDPAYVATAVFERLVYGFHPYGFPNNGTPDSVEHITRDDLVAFHEKYFAPNNALLAIVGDVTAEEAFAGTERVFGAWARRDLPPQSSAAPPDPTRRVVVIDKPDAVQTEVRVGQLAIQRKAPDHMAVDLLVKVLGGEGANRLQRVLRSERGLTYGASADLESYKQAGDIIAETNTRSDATGEVLRVVVDEWARLQRERVSERELGDAQAYLAGSFPLKIETPDEIGTQVLNQLFYDLPLQNLQNFRERVSAVDVDDIQRAARSYLRPDRLSVVLVGNASVFLPQLKALGFDNVEVVPLTDLDLASADFRRRAPVESGPSPTSEGMTDQSSGTVVRRQTRGRLLLAAWHPAEGSPSYTAVRAQEVGARRAPTVPGTEEESDRAKEVLMKAVKARGGLAKIEAVKTVMATAITVFPTPQGQMKAETRSYIEYPDRFRVDAKLPNADVVQVYADGAAWLKDPNGVHDAPADMRDDFKASVHRDVNLLLLQAVQGKTKARLLPDETQAGGATMHVVELSGDDVEPVRVGIDATTGRVEQLRYRVKTPAGLQQVTERFSDFRDVNGLNVAFKAVVERDGKTVVEREVTEFKYNVTLDPGLFKKPQ